MAPTFLNITFHNAGPILFPPPFLILWHAEHLRQIFDQVSRSPIAKKADISIDDSVLTVVAVALSLEPSTL